MTKTATKSSGKTSSGSSSPAKAIKKAKERPKRALTAYFCYLKERREKLKKEFPNLKGKQIVSKMAEEWKAMSKENQAPFIKQAEDDKKRYEREMGTYGGKKDKKAESSDDSSGSTKKSKSS